MSDHLSLARELLRQLLAAGPQKGARLKVLLANEFEKRTPVTFRQAFWNFPKFSAFLAANADLLDVELPDGPGDITVRLRSATGPDPTPTTSPPPSPGRFLPASIWNAFTNPDPHRRRFFHRSSREIVHYLEGSQEPPHPRIAARVAADPSYVEIAPISANQQSTWLKEFLAAVSIPESKRPLLAKLAELPYSSAINTAFTATLGDLAESWRQFRSARVHEIVRAWADLQGVAASQLLGPVHGTPEPAGQPGTAVMPIDQARPQSSDLRRWMHAVVDSLDTAELNQILVPAAALLKLSNRRG